MGDFLLDLFGNGALLPTLERIARFTIAVLTLLASAVASVHIVLRKRDSRAAVAWTGLVWLVPVLGPLLYVLFGVNRIRRRALHERRARPQLPAARDDARSGRRGHPELPGALPQLESLAHLVDRVAGRPLIEGNRVEPLVNGEAAYPAMLEAIGAAQHTIALSTYIFDNDPAGRLFVEALEQAVRRGVEVRVLIDAVGARYSWPSSARRLRRRGVSVRLFGRTLLPWRMPYLNLRNHRKILVVDGMLGFTGGMNIRYGHWVERDPPHPVQDLHFRIEGPVVADLLHPFAEDWAHTTGELLEGCGWWPRLEARGPVVARGISGGPDLRLDRVRLAFLGALACAQQRVQIVTPYFVPDQALITALAVAALRGVRVEVLLPARSNLALVQWASTHQLWQVLEHGCRVYATPPPFDHTKLLLVDDAWVLLGTSNWDARSLRLNFELDVECYDPALARRLSELVDAKRASARRVTLADVDARPLPVRLRDGVARLAAPYL